ncbi:MAG: hypothetical protein RBU29_07385 [bacterium]|jgi:hypothetical protein|nr:hypothetical protein [bacterium]
MKPYSILSFSLLVLLSGFAVSGWTQSVFTTPGGDEIELGKDSTWSIENPLSSSPDFILTPQAGAPIAHLIVKKASEETHYYAKKILYSVETERVSLEGEARVVKGEDYMYGPVKIQFQPDKNMLIVEGTNENPALILYSYENGKFYSESKGFQFTFETKNGKRELKKFQPIAGGHLQSRFYDNKTFPTTLMRKLSPPK